MLSSETCCSFLLIVSGYERIHEKDFLKTSKTCSNVGWVRDWGKNE